MIVAGSHTEVLYSLPATTRLKRCMEQNGHCLFCSIHLLPHRRWGSFDKMPEKFVPTWHKASCASSRGVDSGRRKALLYVYHYLPWRVAKLRSVGIRSRERTSHHDKTLPGHMTRDGPKGCSPYCSVNHIVPLLCTIRPSCGWAVGSVMRRALTVPLAGTR